MTQKSGWHTIAFLSLLLWFIFYPPIIGLCIAGCTIIWYFNQQKRIGSDKIVPLSNSEIELMKKYLRNIPSIIEGAEYSDEYLKRLIKVFEKTGHHRTKDELRGFIPQIKYDCDYEKFAEKLGKGAKTLDAILGRYEIAFNEEQSEETRALLRKHISVVTGRQISKYEVTDLLNQRREDAEQVAFEKKLEESTDATKMSMTEVTKLSGHEFERFLGEVFKKRGYLVKRLPGSGDHGADLLLEKFNEKIAVQAKRHEGTIGNAAVQEVHTAKDYYECDKAWIITTSDFTSHASKEAEKVGVELITGRELERKLKQWGEIE
jgi:HJR/Mrr/RecB family endonuclease